MASFFDRMAHRVTIGSDLRIVETARLLDPIALTRNLWSHRELLSQLSKREIASRYRGTYLGVLWSFLTPIFLLTTFTLVFGVIFQSRWGLEDEGRLDFALVLFCGLAVFNVFAEVVSRAPLLILGQPQYVKKVRFPLEILPITVLASAGANAIMSFLVIVIALAVFRGMLFWTMFLLPLVVLPLFLLCLGLGWVLASLGVFFRDVGHLIGIVTMGVLFLSPIFYPVSSIPEWLQPLYRLNPLTLVIENTRAVLIWGNLPSWSALGTGLVTTLIVALVGYAWFQRTRGGFADVL